MDALRRSTLLTVAACGAVASGLWLAFYVALEPVRDGCNTNLVDSPYASAMAPAHLLAAAVLSGAIWQQTGGSRLTRWGLGGVWLVIAACLAVPDVLGPVGLVAAFAGPLLGLPGLLALAISAAAVARRSRGHGEWDKYAAMATVLAWGCLLLGVPASLAYAWLEGASVFCF